MQPTPKQPSKRLSRRHLLLGGAAAGATALAAVGADSLLRGPAPTAAGAAPALFGADSLSCYGPVQAGIVSPPQAHTRYLALDLAPGTDAAQLGRMLRILTGDIEELTAGRPALADTEPELAEAPAALTIAVGFGRALVEILRPGAAPAWLAPLPAFSLDRLSGDYDGGDLLLIIGGDDQLSISHAARMLEKDIRSFATRRWEQNGFRRARGAAPSDTTMRNLMGQVDGTVNPAPADEDFAALAWLGEDAGPLAGGSALVLRRIRMELDTWDQVDRPGREQTIGRTLSNGAPLTGVNEHDEADFTAVNAVGLEVIPDFAHIRRAHSTDPSERIYRRSINYDEGGEAGLLFACYQRDPLRQFVPIQQRLDELDLLNEWVTHIGSAVFAIPPGFERGGTIGETLL